MSLPTFVSFFMTVGNNPSILANYTPFLQPGPNSTFHYIEEEEGAVSPNTRFAVERAQGGGGLVHLRHCNTNQYLARGPQGSSFWLHIVNGGDETVEDQTAWGCTLFRPQVSSGNRVNLVHVQSGLAVCVNNVTDTIGRRSLWVLTGHVGAQPLVSNFINLEALLVLPKRVVFKGDNGKYLKVVEFLQHLRGYLIMFRGDDRADQRAHFEVVQHRLGYSIIKEAFSKYMWVIGHRDSSYIVRPFNDTNDISQACFNVINGPNDTIGLQAALGEGANLFCQRTNWVSFAQTYEDVLACSARSLMANARLQVEEPVVRRTVWVDFHLDFGRIFNRRPLTANTATHRNESNIEQRFEFDVSYKRTRTSTWNNTIRVMTGVTTKFVTQIPFIAKGQIETTLETEYQREWGGSDTEEESVSFKPMVTLPPWTVGTVSVFATFGTCDIPFSYRQVDHLYNGERVERVLHDGVYDNVNNYDFHGVTTVDPIDRSSGNPIYSESMEERHERLLEIYKAKVAEARAGKLNLEEPTIIAGSIEKSKSED